MLCHRQHLGDEERIAARGARYSLAQLGGHLPADQLVDRGLRERLEP
jgi:hypothetical protein